MPVLENVNSERFRKGESENRNGSGEAQSLCSVSATGNSNSTWVQCATFWTGSHISLRVTALGLLSPHSHCLLRAPKIFLGCILLQKYKKEINNKLEGEASFGVIKVQTLVDVQPPSCSQQQSCGFCLFATTHNPVLVILLPDSGKVSHVHKYWLKAAPRNKKMWVREMSRNWALLIRLDILNILCLVFAGEREKCVYMVSYCTSITVAIKYPDPEVMFLNC